MARVGVLDPAHELLFRQACVPDVHGAHLGELGHLCSIGGDRRARRGTRIGSVEAVVACRDREARRHPLHVVLERPGERLVEVVQVEQQRSLGRCERTEVREVRVAAQLDVQSCGRRVLEIRRHDLRGAPIERERRDQHPPMTDGYEVGLSGGVLLLEQCDGIGTVGCRRPSGVHRRRHLLTRGLSSRASFVDARVHDCGHETLLASVADQIARIAIRIRHPAGLHVGRCDRCIRRCDSPEGSEQVEGMLGRGREIDVLAIVVDEARDQRSRAEPPQLLAVGRRGREASRHHGQGSAIPPTPQDCRETRTRRAPTRRDPRVHRDLPGRRRRTFTFPGRCRIARLRITRTEIPAAHNQSGTPSIARIAQIIVTPSRSHRLPQPNHRRAAGDIPIRQAVNAPAECG